MAPLGMIGVWVGEFSQVFIGHCAFRLSHLNLVMITDLSKAEVKQNLETNLAGNSNVDVIFEKPCDTQTYEEIRQKNDTTD